MKRVFILLILSLAFLPLETTLGMGTKPANVGLQNFGATCYMNSTLQCFLRTQALHEILINAEAPTEIPTELEALAHKNTLAEFINLNKIISDPNQEFKKQNKFLSCDVLGPFKNALQQSAAVTGSSLVHINEQQDATECIALILREILTPLKTYTSTNDDFYFALSNKIDLLFRGRLSSTLKSKCLHCKKDYENTTIDIIQSIELPIQEVAELKLETLLDEYTQIEPLNPEEFYKCEKCPNKNATTKKISFDELPPIVIISIKRIKTEGGFLIDPTLDTDGKPINKARTPFIQRKILTPLSFPKCLTIKPEWTTPNSPSKNKNYDLYGLIMHGGDTDGGHYYAFAKDYATDKWWKYNDSNAHEENPILENGLFYAAFYRRRNIVEDLTALSTKLTELKTQLETLKNRLDQLKNNVVRVQQGSH